MPTISICIIARNESACIADALASALPIADQIVVVDTGSTDGTAEIAASFGADVHRFKWNDSFADARNESLRHATGDWILILDADEAIESPRELFDELMAIPTQLRTVYQLKINNVGDSEHVSPRFFPNRQGLYFEGIIHEQIQHCTGEPVDKPMVQQIAINHTGYSKEEYERKDKTARNLRLLNKAIEHEPDNPFHWFNLGAVHSGTGDWAQVLNCQSVAIASAPRDAGYLALAYASALEACARLNRIDDALRFIETAPPQCYECVDFLANAARIFLEAHSFGAAIKFYRAVIDLAHQPTAYKNLASATWRPYAGIGNAHALSGDYRTAREYYRKALEICPEHEGLRQAIEQIDNQVVSV